MTEEKGELARKVEEQAGLLEKLEQELVVLRANQEHYDARFQHLDKEKHKITTHTEEELRRLQGWVDTLEAEKKELTSKLRTQQDTATFNLEI